MDPLVLIDAWPVPTVAAGFVTAASFRTSSGRTRGAADHAFALASVTKPLIAYAVLVAIEEGSLDLDTPAGPRGSTVRHLLAHASGLGPDSREPMTRPGVRRIYSNAGFEVLGEVVATATSMSVADYLREAVLAPLGMDATELRGSPAHAAVSTLDDLLAFAAELLRPTLVAPETLREATTVQLPGLTGVLPGFGGQDPNDWGLGFELRDHKHPHWTGATNSPETFGHFGRSGTFLWVDPVAAVGCVALTDRDFGPWATPMWPAFSDAVLATTP